MELSNYYIDLLKDDFCTQEPDGFYTFSHEESTESSKPSDLP